MLSYEAQFEGLNSPKQKLLSRFPRPAVYTRYFKSLFRGEVELRLLPSLCNPSLTSIDVGAHHGIFTLGTSLFSRRVVAVEPQHQRAEALRRSLPSNALLVEGALSREPGTATLKIPLNDWDSTSRLDPDNSCDGAWRAERVTLFRMDDIVQDRVGFVKIDVEGHEREVLEGASRIIASDKPSFLIEVEERHRKGSVADVCGFMNDRGYSGFFIEGTAIRPVSEFSVERHQDPARVGQGDRANYSDYINNFIFVDADVTLPTGLPSVAQAVRSSLLRLAF